MAGFAHPPEVRAKASALFAQGRTKSSIATELGVTRPTLIRWLKEDAPDVIPDSGPMSSTEAGDAIIRNITEARGRRKKRPDPLPRTGKAAPPPPAAKGPSDAELTKALAEVMCFPAIPMKMVVGCDFCAEHFADNGGPAAAELVRMAQTRPGLRAALERLHGIYTVLMAGGILSMYMAKPLIHHVAPPEALALVGPFLGIPPRPSMADRPDTEYVDAAGVVHAHPADQTPQAA